MTQREHSANQRNIKLIIFDLAGLVIVYHEETYLKRLAKITNKEVKDIEEEFYQLIFDSEYAKFTEQEAIRRFLKKHGCTEDAKELQKERHKDAILNQETIALIKKLKKHYKVAFATNNAEDEFEENNRKFHLTGLFDYGISSHMIKKRKTEPVIFQKILTHFNIKPEETIFIDDGEKYVTIAKKLGIHGIIFKSVEQIKEELEKAGVQL